MSNAEQGQYMCNEVDENRVEPRLAMRWPNADCIHHFSGATRKRAPFRGWAGAVDAWPLGKAPIVGFGKWTADPRSEYGGGEVRFTCRPYALVMWGANSEKLRVKDKTTHFGFAGLARNGQLRIADLPSGMDARAIFDRGGWQPPPMETLLKKLIVAPVEANSQANTGALSALIDHVRNETCGAYGIASTRLEDVLTTWPQLAELADALNTAEAQLAKLREESKHVRLLQAIYDATS